jgi:hypothetical protein
MSTTAIVGSARAIVFPEKLSAEPKSTQEIQKRTRCRANQALGGAFSFFDSQPGGPQRV